jgi:hypothetical protein
MWPTHAAQAHREDSVHARFRENKIRFRHPANEVFSKHTPRSELNGPQYQQCVARR